MDEYEKKAFLDAMQKSISAIKGNLIMVESQAEDEDFQGALRWLKHVDDITKKMKKVLNKKYLESGAFKVCQVEGHQVETNPESKDYGFCHRCGAHVGLNNDEN